MSGEPPSQFKLEPLAWRVRLARALEFRPREAAALCVLAALILIGATIAFLHALPHSSATAAPPSLSPLPSVSLSGSAPPAGEVVVDVTGAVRKPGVYTLEPNARVIDAITAAGGPAAGADETQINLARHVSDGERIYVPRKGEAPPAEAVAGESAGGGDGSGGKVNINTATETQLEELPGIGPSLAQRIIDYRTQHGPFHVVADLMKVPGIGQKKFDSLKDHVTV